MGFGGENSGQKTENDVDDDEEQQQSKKSGNETDVKRLGDVGGGESVSNTRDGDSKTGEDSKVSLKRNLSDIDDGDSTAGSSGRDDEAGDRESDDGPKRPKHEDEVAKGPASKRIKITEHESSVKEEANKDEENDDVKTDLKVPPLKIVLLSQNAADSDAASGNRSTRAGNSKNPSNLPYVISTVASDSMSESEDAPTSTTSSGLVVGAGAGAGAAGSAATAVISASADKPDDKKDKEKELSSEDQRIANQRVLRSSHKLVQSTTTAPVDGSVSAASDSNYLSVTSTTLTSAALAPGSVTTSSASSLPITSVTATLTTTNATASSSTGPISASTVPSAAAVVAAPEATACPLTAGSTTSSATTATTTLAHCEPAAGETAAIATAATSSETESDHSAYNEHESSSASSSVQLNATLPTTMSATEMHPRKRKLKQAKEQLASSASSSSAPVSQPPYQDAPNSDQFSAYPLHPHEQPISNCYQLFMDIRKQIDKKRKGLFPVQPKPPQSFNDYLMNRCNYILHGSPNAEMPHMDAPDCIPQAMREFYIEQEKERHKLRMQHLSEKEKLVLSVEQEILRVHGRAARALANQSLPYSVCTILRDEEVYNFITPEQEEKDRNARSRYTGRLFLSWLQDVDDKWEKIKENMLIRHRNEAEALHAVQKMDWEWRLNDEFDLYCQPSIEDSHIPRVVVNDNFDLLPT